jgi:MFS transporter, DHA3 family, multidrug efflux protein
MRYNAPMRAFYHLLGNNILASITSFTVWFAITFFTFLETQSVFATGMIAGIYLTMTALSSIWFGSLVDHHRKKSMMLLSSFIAIAIFMIAFAIYMLSPEGAFKDVGNPMLWIFIVLLISGVTVGNIRGIAMPTLVTILVPEDRRDKANGLVGMTFGLSFMAVSAISGILVGLGGMYYVLLFAILGTAIAIAHLLLIRVPEDTVAHMEGQKKTVDIHGTLLVMSAIPGLLALIFFTTFNNFLGGVYMALMDAYGLSLVSVETWGILWAVLSSAFIVGGVVISKYGLGKNPLRAMLLANLVIWSISTVFTIYPSIYPLTIGMFLYLCVMPFIEASEHTVVQKVVPLERQGRVFGFAQSVEQAASPVTAFLIGPITQFIFIPFMTTGAGVQLIGSWFGTGPARGIALVFTLTGVIGLVLTFIAFRSKPYRLLSEQYLKEEAAPVA